VLQKSLEASSLSKRETKRAEIVGKLATHFLEAGLGDTGVRRLAEVAGTSDRMLLYYFENKEEILAAVLGELGGGFTEVLDAVFGTESLRPADAVKKIWEMVRDEATAGQLRLWLDLSSRASRGDPFFGAIVEQMAEGWIIWLSGMLDVPAAEKRPLAELIMSAIDGHMVLFPTDLTKGDAAVAKLQDLLRDL
jgi:AcrR family transcriptional regulator